MQIACNTHYASLACEVPLNPAEPLQFNARVADSRNAMWCFQCRQDVPAQPSPTSGELCCPRCSAELRREAAGVESAKAAAPEAAPPGDSAGCRFDSWECDEQLRHIQRRLHAGRDKQTGAQMQREIARFDPPHLAPSSWHAPKALPKPRQRKDRRRKPAAKPTGSLVWTALSVGTMVLVCGAILLLWAVLSDRGELWAIGLPTAIVGQVVLLVGLVLQIDRLWRDNRTAAAKLDRVDVQLHELRTTTTLMGTSGASPGSAFYAHMAGGASPHLLLNDLKGQLDLLAMRLSREP